MSSLGSFLGTPAYGGQMQTAPAPNLSGVTGPDAMQFASSGTPQTVGGVSWGQILNAAQQAQRGNYTGAFNSAIPQQQQPGMMQGLTFPEEQKKQGDGFGQALSFLLALI